MAKVKALVIDDSRVMRLMVMKSLRDAKLADFEFVEAEDGQDGLVKFDSGKPQIVFVDWNMPKMNGIDFVRKVREGKQNARVPIVMVTSEKTKDKDTEAMERVGTDAYICKPFTIDELQQKLTRLVGAIG